MNVAVLNCRAKVASRL